jgi:hypothetical protein
MRRIATTVGIVFSLALPAARAAEIPLAEVPPSVQAYGDRNKSCAAWTDDCVTCSRKEDAELACSNIGIACQPKDVRCLRQQDDKAITPPQK